MWRLFCSLNLLQGRTQDFRRGEGEILETSLQAKQARDWVWVGGKLGGKFGGGGRQS